MQNHLPYIIIIRVIFCDKTLIIQKYVVFSLLIACVNTMKNGRRKDTNTCIILSLLKKSLQTL